MLTVEQLQEMVGDGKFFCVGFTKRTDGTFRKMQARTVPPKEDGRPNYSPERHGLFLVKDIKAREYRCIPVENIHWITAHGKRVSF